MHKASITPIPYANTNFGMNQLANMTETEHMSDLVKGVREASLEALHRYDDNTNRPRMRTRPTVISQTIQELGWWVCRLDSDMSLYLSLSGKIFIIPITPHGQRYNTQCELTNSFLEILSNLCPDKVAELKSSLEDMFS